MASTKKIAMTPRRVFAVRFRRTQKGLGGILAAEAAPSRPSKTAWAVWKRYAGMRSRQQEMVLFQFSGRSETSLRGGGGSAVMRFQAEASAKGFVPVTIS